MEIDEEEEHYYEDYSDEENEQYYVDYLDKEISSLGYDVEIFDLVIKKNHMAIKIGIYSREEEKGGVTVFSGPIDDILFEVLDTAYCLDED